jgi:hypothetical protein
MSVTSPLVPRLPTCTRTSGSAAKCQKRTCDGAFKAMRNARKSYTTAAEAQDRSIPLAPTRDSSCKEISFRFERERLSGHSAL